MAPSAAVSNDAPGNLENGKENHRPPVFFPEDYIVALKKFSKYGTNSGMHKSIYETIEDPKDEKLPSKSRTLPAPKSSDK
jgi:hypothetical protein